MTKHIGCQIDWLIQPRYSLYAVEIKLSRSQLTTPIVEEVKQKIHALVTPKNLSAQPGPVHVNCVADANYSIG